MKPLRLFLVLALSSLATTTLGCAADTSESDDAVEDPGSSEDEVRSTLLGDVAAVKIDNGVTVAAPEKVKRVLKNIGLQAGAAAPERGGLRCLPGYSLEFIGAKGETKGTAGFLCGGPGSEDRRGAKGSIQIKDKSYLITASDIDALDAIATAPRAAGDILFGADKATITKPLGNRETPVTDAKAVAKLVKAIAGDQVPDPRANIAHCRASRVVTFYKGDVENGDVELASVSLSCSESARGTVTGSLTAGDIHGALKIKAGVVFDVERAATPE